MIGKQVEQYLVQRVIKVGGMGSVYLAMDTMLDTPVALKFILSDFNDHPEMATRFLDEAKVLAKLNLLNCPNIPLLYRYFIWEGKAVMAMEYVPGETLEDMVKRRGPIPSSVSVPLVRQALHGLGFAHRIGVIHRDLKPGNLMLNQEGTVKVIDFGIAKKLEVEGGLTKTNTAIGTPWYMAPEQIMGKPVDARTDIYLMGLVLYELLAGQVPFRADSMYEIHAAHVQKVPDPPTIHYPHISQQVVDVVMKALQKQPEHRFASTEEFIQALPREDSGPVIIDTKRIVTDSKPNELQPTQATKIEKVESAATIKKADKEKIEVHGGQQESSRKGLLIGAAACLLLLVAGTVAWMAMKPSSTQSEAGGPSTIAPAPIAKPDNPEEFATNKPEIPPSTSIPSNPRPSPRHVTPPPVTGERTEKNIVVPPTVTHPQPPQPVAGQELSGVWEGMYSDSKSGDRTRVQLSMLETNSRDVKGTLRFVRTDNTSGECDLSRSTYNAATQNLSLLIHCRGTAPGYFNTPTTFRGINPAGNVLSGGTVFSFQGVNVSMARK